MLGMNLFVNKKLPNQLSDKEINECFKKYNNGDMNARTMIANHNIGLVIHIVSEHFNNTSYDGDELVSIGLIGLIKAIDSFDIDKKVRFGSYASRCIMNEILMFMRNEKKHSYNQFIEDIIFTNSNSSSDIALIDTLVDQNISFEEIYDHNETINEVRKIIEEWSNETQKRIVTMYFGFNGKCYTQTEIAKELNISQCNISRILKKTLKTIGERLIEIGAIEAMGKNIKIK